MQNVKLSNEERSVFSDSLSIPSTFFVLQRTLEHRVNHVRSKSRCNAQEASLNASARPSGLVIPILPYLFVETQDSPL